jgi:hypothetical protein
MSEITAQRWTRSAVVLAPPRPGSRVAVADPMPPQPRPTSRDLALNCPGAASRHKPAEVVRKPPIRKFVARVMGVDMEERARRLSAKGEEKIARELSWLGEEWHVLHAVELGDRESVIDHVLIGPPGVITLNTKRHPNGKAWVDESRVVVNGQPADYVRNSRHEARRSARLLASACKEPVQVRAAIAFVDLDDLEVRQMPKDVYVTTRRRLLVWLKSLPETTDAETVELIYARARFSSTWQ